MGLEGHDERVDSELFVALSSPDGSVLQIAPSSISSDTLQGLSIPRVRQSVKRQVERYRPESPVRLLTGIGALAFNELKAKIASSDDHVSILDGERSQEDRQAYEEFKLQAKRQGITSGELARRWRVPDDGMVSVSRNRFPMQLDGSVSQFIVWVGRAVGRERLIEALSAALSCWNITEDDFFLTRNTTPNSGIQDVEHWHLYVRSTAARQIPL